MSESATGIKRSAVTMADVAREVGVTKMTVSFALNGTGRVSEETRQTVLKAAHRLGFEPNPHAQRLNNGYANNTIGLFVLWFDFGVGTQKIQFIQGHFNERGFDVPIYGVGLRAAHNEAAQATAIATIRRQKPRALVCSTSGLRPKALVELQRYQDEGGILVCYDHEIELECDRVFFDRADNTYRTTRYLLELGHRRVGFCFHGNLRPTDPRLAGFERALNEFGLEPRPDWLFSGKDQQRYAEGGREIARQYLQLKERPTALSIVNDATALTFLAEVQRAGLQCPQDASVVGHDDYEMSRYYPVPLSTASHPSETIARHVTELILSRIAGDYSGPAHKITVQGELIARQSAIALA